MGDLLFGSLCGLVDVWFFVVVVVLDVVFLGVGWLVGFVSAFVCFLKTDLGQANKYLPTAFSIFLQRRLSQNK